MKIANVLYVKVGVVTSTKLENSKRTELISGIKKYPVSKAYLTKTGFKEDFQPQGAVQDRQGADRLRQGAPWQDDL